MHRGKSSRGCSLTIVSLDPLRVSFSPFISFFFFFFFFFRHLVPRPSLLFSLSFVRPSDLLYLWRVPATVERSLAYDSDAWTRRGSRATRVSHASCGVHACTTLLPPPPPPDRCWSLGRLSSSFPFFFCTRCFIRSFFDHQFTIATNFFDFSTSRKNFMMYSWLSNQMFGGVISENCEIRLEEIQEWEKNRLKSMSRWWHLTYNIFTKNQRNFTATTLCLG